MEYVPSLERMGIDTRGVVNVGGFTEGQRRYLDFYRNSVLLRAVHSTAMWWPESEFRHSHRAPRFGKPAVW